MKSDKTPYIIYADLESLIKKIDVCENNPENSSATKIDERIPCGYSISKVWGFDHTENKHNLYLGRDCLKNFRDSLNEHAKNIIDFEKKKMLLLTKKRIKITQKWKRMLYLW